jgi:hypothetical protein
MVGGPRLWGARKLTPASPSLVRCRAGALIATLTMLIVWAGAMANWKAAKPWQNGQCFWGVAGALRAGSFVA